MTMQVDLDGRVAIVTGSGQGIGAIKEVVEAAQLVDRLAREYDAARERVVGTN